MISSFIIQNLAWDVHNLPSQTVRISLIAVLSWMHAYHMGRKSTDAAKSWDIFEGLLYLTGADFFIEGGARPPAPNSV